MWHIGMTMGKCSVYKHSAEISGVWTHGLVCRSLAIQSWGPEFRYPCEGHGLQCADATSVLVWQGTWQRQKILRNKRGALPHTAWRARTSTTVWHTWTCTHLYKRVCTQHAHTHRDRVSKKETERQNRERERHRDFLKRRKISPE